MSTDSTQQLLAEMVGYVREERKFKQLTFEDCLPYIAKVYRTMSTMGQKTGQVTIDEILTQLESPKLSTPMVSYKCDDKDNLSRQICARLTENKIPAEPLFVNHSSTVVIGVMLKLCR